MIIFNRIISAIQLWYNENQYWNYDLAECEKDKVCGHFTQQVWKDSTRVCYGYYKDNDGWEYVSARYQPRGNYKGQYKNNVFPPSS